VEVDQVERTPSCDRLREAGDVFFVGTSAAELDGVSDTLQSRANCFRLFAVSAPFGAAAGAAEEIAVGQSHPYTCRELVSVDALSTGDVQPAINQRVTSLGVNALPPFVDVHVANF